MKRKLVFITGPTASGKTSASIELAQKLGATIFNCDSIQVYKELNCGSAKPTLEERRGVDHRLFDLLSAPEVMTAGKYRELFLSELEKFPSSKPIFVVGGTGFYFMALEKGMFHVSETPPELKAQIQREWEEGGGKTESFYEELKKRDPQHAQKIHANDTYRILRAIEILRMHPDKNLTQLVQEKENEDSEFEIFKANFHVEVSELEKRIRIRTQKMLKQGLLEEVKSLLDNGLEHWAPLNSVGYFEAKQFFRGELSTQDLEERIIISTRQLAKKQRTWFQRDDHHCVITGLDLTGVQAQLARFLQDG